MAVHKRLCSLCYFTTTAQVILMWHFANSLLYYLFLEQPAVSLLMDSRSAITTAIVEALLSFFSPLAGLLADVKYGSYKVLKISTYCMITFEFLTLIAWILMAVIVDSIDYKYYLSLFLLVLSLACYYLGRVFFVTNIIQFGIDQLQDMPTTISDAYIHIFFLVEQVANILVKVFKSIPDDKIELDANRHIVHISVSNAVVYEVCISLSVIVSVAVLLLTDKYSSSFKSNSLKVNPYYQVYAIIKYAYHHKKPVRRSAFTYCEDERPSRIDYGKQRYGGPFTTEQVEDVKVFINISKVLVIVSPFFSLDLYSTIVLSNYHKQSHSIFDRVFFHNGILLSLTVIVSIPFFLFLVKPYFSRYIPSIFKRMGMSLLIMSIFFLIYILCGFISKDNESYSFNSHCVGVNNSSIHGLQLVSMPEMFLQSLQLLLSAVSQMLFYIAVWQFICCQSPQYMKGLLFGVYFFIKAIIELFSLCFLHFSIFAWDHIHFGCELDVCIFHFVIGIVSLIVMVAVTRKYKYRKRDDICNVYQYAEDYYSYHS